MILSLIVFIYAYINVKINPNRGESYIDFPNWIKNKKNKYKFCKKENKYFLIFCNSYIKS